MKPHLIGNEPVAGEPGPVQQVPYHFNTLLCRPTAIVEVHYALGFSGQIGNDEAHSWE